MLPGSIASYLVSCPKGSGEETSLIPRLFLIECGRANESGNEGNVEDMYMYNWGEPERAPH